jgi:hypothetical protein
MKFCRDCRNTKPLSAFYVSTLNKDGYPSYCRECANKRAKASPNWEKNIRKAQLKKNYGITPEQYASMLAKQCDVCAICHRPESGKRKYLCVDHNHETGQVRGLLCPSCNIALGKFQDDPIRLSRAIQYLAHTPIANDPQ